MFLNIFNTAKAHIKGRKKYPKIEKVIIIHDYPDDFTTQPSGNSGTKIACGKIER